MFSHQVFERNRLNKVRSFGRKGMQVSSAMDQVLQEVAIMKKLDHPTLVKLHEIIDDSESDQLFLVMEYAAQGTVQTLLENGGLFTEERAAEAVAAILEGLVCLHAHHIAHRGELKGW